MGGKPRGQPKPVREPAEWNLCTVGDPLRARDDDMIIRGVRGEFHPCRSDVFLETYEVVAS